MTNIIFTRAIINMAIFLEFSDDVTVNEDASIEALEQLALDLQSMTNIEKKEFRKSIFELSNEYAGDRKEFVLSFPEAFGLLE